MHRPHSGGPDGLGPLTGGTERDSGGRMAKMADGRTMPGGERPAQGRRQSLPRYDAIVLTGGQARRLGGAYKPGIVIGGQPLAARVVSAVADAGRVVFVGPPVAGVAADVVTYESPPGGGPAAALDAGLAHVTAPVVAALAGDLPFLTRAVVDELRLALEADPAAAAAVLVDDAGFDQPLCAVWRTELLQDALATVGDPSETAAEGAPRVAEAAGRTALGVRRPGEAEPGRRLDGVSLRDLLAAAEPLVRRTVVVDSGPPPWFDCDTEDDIARAREWT
jgi:molybdenum cofactor guanylyltransferase